MSRRERIAWVLNLDAEDELVHLGAHTPTAAMKTRIEALLPRLRTAGLVHPDDVVVWPPDGRDARGLAGHAWCPTRWALERLQRANALVPEGPAPEVLRLVNHRKFAHQLGQALPLAAWVEDFAQLDTQLSQTAALAQVSKERNWLLKRPLGFAGRGRRKVATGPLAAADRAWIDASLRTDGLQVEPWVARELDCALHGFVSQQGDCSLGRPTLQEIDASGAWKDTVLAPTGALTDAELEVLEHTARTTAEALHAAGYFGPFGIDAFRWRDADGQPHFQPRSEVNARYSMGWAVGTAAVAPSLAPRPLFR